MNYGALLWIVLTEDSNPCLHTRVPTKDIIPPDDKKKSRKIAWYGHSHMISDLWDGDLSDLPNVPLHALP